MTDRELQKIYVAAKINYNPLDYTLSDRLLIESGCHLPSITEVGYDSETHLINVINANLKTSKGICEYERESILSTFVKERTDWSLTRFYDFLHNEYSLLMNYRNNLYIDGKLLRDAISIALYDKSFSSLSVTEKEAIGHYIDGSRCLEAIVTLNVALRDNSSILPVLKFATYPEYLTYTYEELLNGKYIKDYIESDTFINIPIGYTCLRDSIMCLNNRNSVAFSSISNVDIKEDACIVSALNTVLYGIEILHALETIKDDKLKLVLEDLLAKGYKDASITSELYEAEGSKIIIKTEILNIVKEMDNRKRFKNIALYLANEEVLARIVAVGKLMCSYPDKYGAAVFLSDMVNFCNEYCLQSIRTRNVLKLIEYIKEHGWKLTSESLPNEEMSEIIGDLSFRGGEADSGDDADEDEEPTTKIKDGENSMLDFHDHPHFDGFASGPENKFKKTPAIIALDEAISSFDDGTFKYDVKDIIDTSDRYKDKYNAIVENVSLLNKNLIKKIKEIKVYNEGGKNPGLSSGKLDMKNIWRYKTTDKIFCKNTYKIKESDLAIGAILDVSGSMHGEGIKNGVITMVILHETLKALNINHSIITHTEHKGYHTCDIKRYQNFKEQKTYSVRKNYALAGIVAESGNCDAAALKYMETAFSRVRNKDKICLIFSDGEPTECSDSELLKQIKHMEYNGIKVIGIGVNFSNIKEYYKDNANGKNLKEMLDIVSNILKQYVLDKKE